MSKLLQRALSAAVFPAALMITSKVIGMYLANKIFNLGWWIDTNSQGLFSVQVVYPDIHSAIVCNTYSNLFMYLMILLGTCYFIFQGYFLHTTHQNPRVLVKMINFDFLAWLTESSSLFPKMAIWLSFLWVSTVIILVQTIQESVHMWVGVAVLVLTSIFTSFAIRDFEKEVKTILPEHGKLSIK